MALITRIAPYESILCFRRSAAARYREGCRLAANGDRLIGIYLLGYAAEMLLKAAYFRLERLHVKAPIGPAQLRSARDKAVSWGITAPVNYHDLSWWAQMLVESRQFLGRSYSYHFARQLLANVNRIYQNWREFLRYRTNRPFRGEVETVVRATTWLVGQYRYLY
jgi:hypothetical protein